MTTSIIVERNVPATMRDGTVLYADIYRPDADGEYPILLTRIPYGKHDPFYSHRYLDTHRFVDNGFIVIIQDVRGRFASEGDFSMFTNEAKDGYDTVEWAAQLPYADGNVGMFGLSYYGYTQLLAATENPPHLKAIFPAQTLNDSRTGAMYQNGAFSVGLFQSLILGTFIPDLLKRKYAESDPATYYQMMQKWAHELDDMEKWYERKPVQEWSILKEFGLEGDFLDMISHELSDEAYWETLSILNKYEKIEVPAYHVAGLYDCFLQSTIDNYVNMEVKTNHTQKLMIGPWAHGNFGHVIGERSFGIGASEHFIDLKEDLTALHIRWFDHWLKGKETGITEEAPVKVFTMGVNEWREENEWPLERTKYTPFYFHGNGKANTRFGDGTLDMNKPSTEEPADTFTYDPANPVRSNGGGTLYEGVAIDGPQDQRKTEEREDILVYTSEPLEEALEVTGRITVHLWAKTDAKDTDFTAKLIDVAPDGTAYNLTDGIVRAQYRNGHHPELNVQDEIIEYEIDIWSTSNVFLPGHQIRVEISSSNYPRFDVNLNTGKSVLYSDEMVEANQTIYHDETYPSHIVLPVIPKE